MPDEATYSELKLFFCRNWNNMYILLFILLVGGYSYVMYSILIQELKYAGIINPVLMSLSIFMLIATLIGVNKSKKRKSYAFLNPFAQCCNCIEKGYAIGLNSWMQEYHKRCKSLSPIQILELHEYVYDRALKDQLFDAEGLYNIIYKYGNLEEEMVYYIIIKYLRVSEIDLAEYHAKKFLSTFEDPRDLLEILKYSKFFALLLNDFSYTETYYIAYDK